MRFETTALIDILEGQTVHVDARNGALEFQQK